MDSVGGFYRLTQRIVHWLFPPHETTFGERAVALAEEVRAEEREQVLAAFRAQFGGDPDDIEDDVSTVYVSGCPFDVAYNIIKGNRGYEFGHAGEKMLTEVQIGEAILRYWEERKAFEDMP